MRPPATLTGFFVAALVWFVLLTVGWMQVSPWTSHPVAALSHIVLGNGASDWVRAVHKKPGHFEVDTRIAVAMADPARGKGSAELVAEADPARHGYGLPLYLALLLAARGKRLLFKALVGYSILLLPQTFSLCLDVLKQFVVFGGSPAVLGIAQWQMDVIALGYQFGSLILPTLAPVVLWLWFDRTFFASVIIDGWLRRQPDSSR